MNRVRTIETLTKNDGTVTVMFWRDQSVTPHYNLTHSSWRRLERITAHIEPDVFPTPFGKAVSWYRIQ